MTQKIDLKEEAVELRNSNEDEASTNRLALANLEVKLKELECRQEECRLNRLEKNSKRRPWLYAALLIVIGFSYVLFFIAIVRDLVGYTCPLFAASQTHIVEVALLGIIPTVLITIAMKAVFSSTPKKETDAQIKLSDAIPIKAIKDASFDGQP